MTGRLQIGIDGRLHRNTHGVIELIENGSPAFRCVYCAKHGDKVYVLHAFTKTTNGVDKAAMETVKERYKAMMALVAEDEREKKKK